MYELEKNKYIVASDKIVDLLSEILTEDNQKTLYFLSTNMEIETKEGIYILHLAFQSICIHYRDKEDKFKFSINFKNKGEVKIKTRNLKLAEETLENDKTLLFSYLQSQQNRVKEISGAREVSSPEIREMDIKKLIDKLKVAKDKYTKTEKCAERKNKEEVEKIWSDFLFPDIQKILEELNILGEINGVEEDTTFYLIKNNGNLEITCSIKGVHCESKIEIFPDGNFRSLWFIGASYLVTTNQLLNEEKLFIERFRRRAPRFKKYIVQELINKIKYYNVAISELDFDREWNLCYTKNSKRGKYENRKTNVGIFI